MFPYGGDTAIFKGTSSATPTTFLMTNPISKKASWARKVVVKNTGGTNAIQVFLPANSNAATVAANGEETFEGPITQVTVLQGAGASTFEIYATVA